MMKSKIYILILAIIGILLVVSLFIDLKQDIQTQEIEKQNLEFKKQIRQFFFR